jgi:hypothetical protein
MVVRRLPAWTYAAIAAIPILILVSADFAFRFSSSFDSLSRIGLIVPALVWLLAFSVIGWKRLDESGREAHKFAWFHGGGLGLLAAMLAVMAVFFIPAGGRLVDGLIGSWASKWPPGQGGFALGVLAAAIAQAVGYAIVWAGWWMARRR